ncbi:hypothetical protein D1P53_004758 [Cryptococcus gattii VGV]|nr:hypothetical protein D1P53_004758 [Cryptococcus gattii VGV]
MALVVASLIFAITLSALPSTEPPDEEECRQHFQYLVKKQREKKKLSSMSEEVGDRAPRETGMGKGEVVAGKVGKTFPLQPQQAHRFSDLFAAYSFDPAHDQSTDTHGHASSHSFSSPFLPESCSSDSVSTFAATSVEMYKYRGTDLRRVSSVPSLSLSAGCSPEGSVLGSPKLGSMSL